MQTVPALPPGTYRVTLHYPGDLLPVETCRGATTCMVRRGLQPSFADLTILAPPEVPAR